VGEMKDGECVMQLMPCNTRPTHTNPFCSVQVPWSRCAALPKGRHVFCRVEKRQSRWARHSPGLGMSVVCYLRVCVLACLRVCVCVCVCVCLSLTS
jgi:hypothetical protein